MKRGGTALRKPGRFVWMEIDGESAPQRSVAKGLRNALEDNYHWFCENFMECVIPTSEWKLQSKKKLLSECVEVPLEAFAALLHQNGCNKWTETFRSKEDDDTDVSSLSNASRGNHGFLHTVDSRGSRKHEGWSNAGMTFHNDILLLISAQRRNPGCRFEHILLKRLAENRRRSCAESDDPNQAPRAT
jgi:hypothetical protein